MRITFVSPACGILITLLHTSSFAGNLDSCVAKVSIQISVDQGHPARPPFWLDRVGAAPIVRVELKGDLPQRQYRLAVYRGGHEIESRRLDFVQNVIHRTATDRDTFFANLTLTAVPDAVTLFERCGDNKEWKERLRQVVTWPALEAQALARAENPVNPVDLGAIQVPYDELLLFAGQAAEVEVAAFSRLRSIPKARIKAWFTGQTPVEIGINLPKNRRLRTALRVAPSSQVHRDILHIALVEGESVLWDKKIPTMIASQVPRWPEFGAVEVKLRHDDASEQSRAWDPKLSDVVVFLPNGSRFVFWRGLRYAPFWAGPYNTGLSYEWAETVHLTDFNPDGPGMGEASVEPLMDTELHYGRVRIMESTASRVHVRWTYQGTTSEASGGTRFRVWGDQATEDFYFYPDGFGTRVMTLTSAPDGDFELSEFIVWAPKAAAALDILPEHIVDMLYLDGEKHSITFPYPTFNDLPHQILNKRKEAMLYRITQHKSDPATAIYYSPNDVPNALYIYSPFYDRGEIISRGYGTESSSLVTWGLPSKLGNGPKPLSAGQFKTIDTLGQSREMLTRRWSWLIAKTAVADAEVLDWAKSYSAPPSLEVTGARLAFPSYSAERRAMCLVAESSSIDIRINPEVKTMNPVFEIEDPRGALKGVTIDGKALYAEDYAWDGRTLWVRAVIGPSGSRIGLNFGS